jgi:LysM repeat protein
VVTISRGDTIRKITRDFRVSLSDLAEANPGTNVVKLKVGQKLRIPRPGAVPTTTPAAGPAVAGDQRGAAK